MLEEGRQSWKEKKMELKKNIKETQTQREKKANS